MNEVFMSKINEIIIQGFWGIMGCREKKKVIEKSGPVSMIRLRGWSVDKRANCDLYTNQDELNRKHGIRRH
jgi:hypothetical protein